ncbi:alpha/beta fold hydrolase [Lysinibacillus capsici]|uniref:alpha/beta hydrolase n=1 Tax=Lysinibacillus capsici TaxID=2115968 RepID=UPI0029DE87FC|nr:alpha/beta fold hydrolase [Lysinibacillus capsici]WPK07500.1 alpha/beta fold hydrolase [Lysinibacillus capsici]
MNVIKSKNIYLKGTKQAILLLHSFTGSANEMRGLAKHLHKQGFSCYAPNYKGHGEIPEKLFESSVEQAWETVEESLYFLQEEGHQEIIVIGQSLGGVMTLRVAMSSICEATVVISAPLMERSIEGLESRMRSYTKHYYNFQKKPDEWIEHFLEQHFPRPIEKLLSLQQFILKTQSFLPTINKPICLFKGARDDAIYQDSIDLIEANVRSSFKKKITYPNSGHLLTLDKDRELLFQEIQLFIQQIFQKEPSK